MWHQVYYFLTVLRCLWLRDARPDLWEAVTSLVSNTAQRRGTKVFNFNQTYVVDTLEHFGVTQFSQQEIQTVCGIFGKWQKNSRAKKIRFSLLNCLTK